MQWHECPLVGVRWGEYPLGYAMTWMSAWKLCRDVNAPCGCAMRWMPAWVCNDINVRLEICHDVNAPLWVCNDVNARVGMQWHECPLVGMQWHECLFGYAMNANARLGMQWMHMSHWEYAMTWMSTWEYAMAWMSSCRYAMDASVPLGMQWMRMPTWVCHDTNALMQTNFFQKFPLFSKQGFLSAWNLIYYSWKSHLLFWLKAPQKLVITVRNLRMGY